MKKLNYKILNNLCNIYAPSGFELEIINYILKEIKNPLFDHKITKKQSLVVYNKDYNSKCETIMLDAHIDQVHMKVVKILKDGTVIALPVGFDGEITDGLNLVHLKTNKIGVVNTNPPHLNLKRRDTNEIYIDFGQTYEKITGDIFIGDYIMFKSQFELIGKDNINGTGLDNKASIFILLELINKCKKINYNLVFNFSSREETGLGSISLLFNSLQIEHLKKINDILTIDTVFVTNSEIIGDISYSTSEINSDCGPVITRNSDDDVSLGDSFLLIASKNKIPVQIAYTGDDNGGSNNTAYSRYTDAYTQMIGIPLKHMHSPTELISKNDIYNTYLLLWKYINYKF